MQKLELGEDFDTEIIETSLGLIVFKATGKNAYKLFNFESGGHRWQRIPPTEKRGRVQTSTVTVAVFKLSNNSGITQFKLSDIDIRTTKGSGPGGQHRNKTETTVVATHLPTGITARCDGRSQFKNKEDAIDVLNVRVQQHFEALAKSKVAKERQMQVGSGMRGDKIRTVRVQDGCVINHLNGKRLAYSEYAKGNLAAII